MKKTVLQKIKRFAVTALMAATLAVTMAAATPATTQAASSSYGVNINSSAYTSEDIYKKPQCTWYSWGRTREKMGIKLGRYGNAKDWYANAKKAGYSVGKTPQPNSIGVFGAGSYKGKDNPYGHVVFVEKVENGRVYISEGNYSGMSYHEDSYKISDTARYGAPLTGYIYLCGHDYNTQGVCNKCKANYPLNTTEYKKTMTVCAVNGTNTAPAHTAPYGDAPIPVRYKMGDTVKVVGKTTNMYNNTWYKLSDGTWIVGDYVK